MADIVRGHSSYTFRGRRSLRFADSVTASRIREGASYEGVRVKLTAYLDAARVALTR